MTTHIIQVSSSAVPGVYSEADRSLVTKNYLLASQVYELLTASELYKKIRWQQSEHGSQDWETVREWQTL